MIRPFSLGFRMTDPYEKLDACLRERMRTPFAWGHDQQDCVSFCFAAVRAFHNRDLHSELGLKGWSTERGACRAIVAFAGRGKSGFERAVVKAFEDLRAVRVTRGFAQRGDLALLAGHEDQPALMGVVYPCAAGRVCAPGEAGLVWHDLAAADRVFRLGVN